MNVLHLTTSIRGTDSVSTRLSTRLADRFKTAGHAVIHRDLHADPVPMLDGEGWAQVLGNTGGDYVKTSDALIDELLAKDVLVLGAPMYNFSIPAQLKNYIDAIARAGKTFKYSEQGAVGLTHIKTAYVLLSKGGVYDPAAYSAQEDHLNMLLRFLGVKDVVFLPIEGQSLGPVAAESSIKQVEERIDALTLS